MVFNKKAISPVVATALLLVVAVVAVVGFQSWFTSYQSGVNAKVEQESAGSAIFTVQRLESDQTNSTVYVKNNAAAGTAAVNVTVKLPGCAEGVVESASTPVSANSVLSITVPVCNLVDGAKEDVVVVAETGVYSSTQIVK